MPAREFGAADLGVNDRFAGGLERRWQYCANDLRVRLVLGPQRAGDGLDPFIANRLLLDRVR